MDPRTLVLGTIVAGLLAAPAAAQDLTVYVDGGFGLPADPPEFEDFWNTGAGLGAGVGLRVSPEWELVGSLHWNRFPIDEAAQADDLLLQGFGQTLPIASIDGRDATVLALLAEARLHLSGDTAAVRPFLSFGWGFVDLSTSDALVTADVPGFEPVAILGESDGAFAVGLGGGAALPISSRFQVVVDIFYTIGFTELFSTQYLPVRVGIGYTP